MENEDTLMSLRSDGEDQGNIQIKTSNKNELESLYLKISTINMLVFIFMSLFYVYTFTHIHQDMHKFTKV